MTDATSTGGDSSARRSQKFEDLALSKVAELGQIDIDAFTASFDLFRLTTRYLGHLDAEIHRPLGLSVAGFRVLFTTWLHGEMEPRELADLAGVSRAAVSGVLNTLERSEYVQRSRESRDRRLVTVRITAQGQQLLSSAYVRQNEFEVDFFGALSAEELTAFTDTLRKLLGRPLKPQSPSA